MYASKRSSGLKRELSTDSIDSLDLPITRKNRLQNLDNNDEDDDIFG